MSERSSIDLPASGPTPPDISALPDLSALPGISAVVELASCDVVATAESYRQLLALGSADPGFRVGRTDVRIRPNTARDHRILLIDSDIAQRARLMRRRGLVLVESGAGTGEWHAISEPVGVMAPPDRGAATLGVGVGHDLADIVGIDHLVFECSSRDHAVALFGSTLGLDFRLDRQLIPGLRQLFFRTADLVVEVIISDGINSPSGSAAPIPLAATAAHRCRCGGSPGAAAILN